MAVAEDFLDTLELAKEVQYDSAFTFIYSRRNNTPADMMLDQVSEEDKRTRRTLEDEMTFFVCVNLYIDILSK